MNRLTTSLSIFTLLLCFIFESQAQFVGPAPLVVPGDNYAFAYSPNGTVGALTTFGLYFNETSATNPGYEFRGSGSSKLVTIQSIAKGNREPGDITFGATGSLIINPNRYAFRFSLTNSYGLFFNAADFAYEFRTADASPVLSIGADNGDLTAVGHLGINGAAPIYPLTLKANGYGFSHSFGDVDVGTWVGAFQSDTGGWFGTNSNHPLYFYVNDSEASVAIDLNENVGIGTYLPQFRLDVRGDNVDDAGILQLGNEDASHKVVIFPGRELDPNPFILWKEGDPMRFASDAGGFTEYMRVDTNGNLGVGTQSPLGKIHADQTDGLYAGYFTADSLSDNTHVVHAVYSRDSVLSDAKAVYAESRPQNYWGIGTESVGGFIGVLGTIEDDGSGLPAGLGVFGQATGNSTNFSTKYGVYGVASQGDSTTTNYSIYGDAGFSAGMDYAGYFAGDVTVTGTLTNPSDARLKQNISDIENASELIRSLKVQQYEFDHENYAFMSLPQGTQYGLIAQEVERVLPELVKQNIHPASDPKMSNGVQHDRVEYKSVNYLGLLPLLVQAVNEQAEIITEKEEAVETLQSQVETLTDKVTSQDQRIADIETKFAAFETALSSCCTGQKTGDLAPDYPMEHSKKGAWLGQNIPNPFDKSTIIQYYIPGSVSQSSIIIYDQQGKEIRSFDLEQGYGEVKFSQFDLSSGTYIYTLINDGMVVSTKKMIMN